MRLVVGGRVRRGRAIDARDLDASGAAVAAAIHARGEDSPERPGGRMDPDGTDPDGTDPDGADGDDADPDG
ncbi:MAG: hypothetical protein ABEJ74_07520, partial [Haloferacaceae archaeon]